MKRLTVVALTLVVSTSLAERLPESRKDATLVVVGTVKKVKAAAETYNGDGEITFYFATVKIEKIEKGDAAKPGEDLELYWYKITKPGTKRTVGGSSHPCSASEKDRSRFWIKKGSRGWEIVFADDGVEKVKKEE